MSPQAWAQSFPQLLRAAGYFTGWVGKNHVPVGDVVVISVIFLLIVSTIGTATMATRVYPKENGNAGKIYDNAEHDTQPEVFLEGALNFLNPHEGFIGKSSPTLPVRPTDKPFCLCLTFNLPHDSSTSGMQLRPEDDELYKSHYRDQINELPRPETWAGFNAPPKILVRCGMAFGFQVMIM